LSLLQGIRREWAPFVLTPDFVHVMGGEVSKLKHAWFEIPCHNHVNYYCALQQSEIFQTYKNLCCRAFLILRRHADLIISLFALVS
ncbi:MAG: hypothetical protein MJE68_22650, partial [Proteobacteria bacterium]|nr:hypothetical protein [Pseudomonadota bacterium]